MFFFYFRVNGTNKNTNSSNNKKSSHHHHKNSDMNERSKDENKRSNDEVIDVTSINYVKSSKIYFIVLQKRFSESL